jgi:hypothetical protein
MFIRADGSISASTISATTISATTYENLPVDPNYYTTAFTYSNNVFTIKQTGQADLTAIINSVTGWTVNGDLTVTGTTTSTNISGGTISGGTMVITSTPTNNDSPTEVLTRNSTTGQVESTSPQSPGLFNYGLANAIMTGNFLT